MNRPKNINQSLFSLLLSTILASCTFSALAVSNYTTKAIFKAIRAGDIKTIELTLDDEIDINALKQDGCSALYAACEAGRLNIFRFLVNHGASKSDDSDYLFAAIQGGNLSIVKHLVEIWELNPKEPRYLDWATHFKNPRIFSYLADQGATLKDVEDLPFDACRNSLFLIVRYFLTKKSFNPNVTSSYWPYKKPLQEACSFVEQPSNNGKRREYTSSTIRLLINNGAIIDVQGTTCAKNLAQALIPLKPAMFKKFYSALLPYLFDKTKVVTTGFKTSTTYTYKGKSFLTTLCADSSNCILPALSSELENYAVENAIEPKDFFLLIKTYLYATLNANHFPIELLTLPEHMTDLCKKYFTKMPLDCWLELKDPTSTEYSKIPIKLKKSTYRNDLKIKFSRN
ncbi:MAG: Ankyrin [candidate division TM6 bacterium GW2011_GWF2_43_87]|nr:MAG: Ankyrin [candidate division TM6 bacterium GW2011_GWF2_43_87]